MAINKPNDYDTAQAWGEYTPLAPGGYICRILNAKETKSKAGNVMVEFIVDICEGPEAGRFKKEFERSTKDDKKWSNNATCRQLTNNVDGTTHGGFKNLVQTIEESNNTPVVWGDGFVDWMKGKTIGLVFGREQYEYNGELKWATRVGRGYKTVEQIIKGEFTVPEDKLLEPRQSLAEYMAAPIDAPPGGFGALQDDDIPF